jgi:hypothetical protein
MKALLAIAAIVGLGYVTHTPAVAGPTARSEGREDALRTHLEGGTGADGAAQPD